MIEPAHSIPGTTVPTISEKPVAHLTGQYAEAHQFDFRRLWHSLVERIWIVAICVLAGLFLALGYLARTPKLYQRHTLLEVEFQEPSFVPTADYTTRTRSVFLASQEALKTIEQNLTNQTLLARVVRSEGLAQDGGHAVLGQSVVANKSSSATERTEPSQAGNKTETASGGTTVTPLEQALARGLIGMVTSATPRGTRLSELYVRRVAGDAEYLYRPNGGYRAQQYYTDRSGDHHPRVTIQGQAPQNDGGQGLAGRGESKAP